MGNRINQNDDDAIVEINITPFVDIVLVLLVIFMVTAHLITNRGIPLQLPKGQTSEKINTTKNLQILITADGKFLLDKKWITLEQLKQSVGLFSLNRKEKVTVTISADKGVAYESVIQLMDALRSQGVLDFALQIEPER